MSEPLNLGQFIDALQKVPSEKRDKVWIMFRFGHADVGNLNSYRGYYERLALSFDGHGGETVETLLKLCLAADGATFEGYKGGRYKMSRDSLLHVASYGDTSETRIIGVTWDNRDFDEPEFSKIAFIETAEFPE